MIGIIVVIIFLWSWLIRINCVLMFSLNLEDFFMNFCKLRVWIFLMYGLDIFKK